MNDTFDSDLHDYLLNQMDAGRRAAFEQRLQREPELRAALQREADAFASFACAAAPAAPLGADDQREVLRALAAATQVPPSSAPAAANVRRARFAWAWPAAAAILLLLNFVDFERPWSPGGDRNETVARDGKRTPDAVERGGAESTREAGGKGEDTANSARGAASLANASSPATLQAEIEKLRAEKTELERTQERLRVDFAHEMQVVQERAAAEGNLNRLTTMELVDPASYAKGERRGLVSVGRGILTEPGVVVPTDTTPPPPLGTSLAGPHPPYAWSVFDEKERRGYLNLYQMPVVTDEQALQIWIRPADAKDFQRVGEVPPSAYGGNTGVQYVLPPNTAAPAEVLITIERRNVPSSTPTGPTVLRGP